MVSDRFNYDVAAIVHPLSDVLVRVGIYSDKDVLEALSILREFADGENDQSEREGMHKVLDAVEALYKSREE
ncbi:hypothetical protein LCGC14_0799170 [marine sediment metagenome]|uniref:Uncharacterized protein n=1 Tax=marine sediment metagenome TaxID=412755 RepID=A0A0F9PUN0_9ZZZZ